MKGGIYTKPVFELYLTLLFFLFYFIIIWFIILYIIIILAIVITYYLIYFAEDYLIQDLNVVSSSFIIFSTLFKKNPPLFRVDLL